jgi:uncharacterized protein YrrD
VDNRHVKGLPVIGIADGRKIGVVGHVFFEPAAKRVAGFSVMEAGGGLFSTEPERAELVDVEEVHSLGPDAMILDPAAARGARLSARYGEFVRLEDLLGRTVVTAGGVEIGAVSLVDFDERGYQLNAIEVSPGLFKSHRTIPTEQVLSLGPDAVVVVEAAGEAETGGAETREGTTEEAGQVLAPPAASAGVRNPGRSEYVVGDVETG